MDSETSWAGVGLLFLAVALGGAVFCLAVNWLIRARHREETARLQREIEQRRYNSDRELEDRGQRAATVRDERYGERHQEEREKYAATIRDHGGVCMEKVCIMPTRRIAPGAFWHLAHDHERGGLHDYLGPAHPECNQYEALARGATWDGAPTIGELLAGAECAGEQEFDRWADDATPPELEADPPDPGDVDWMHEVLADEGYYDIEDVEDDCDDLDSWLAYELDDDDLWPGEDSLDDRHMADYGETWTDDPWEARDSDPLPPLWMPADIAEEIAQEEGTER